VGKPVAPSLAGTNYECCPKGVVSASHWAPNQVVDQSHPTPCLLSRSPPILLAVCNFHQHWLLVLVLRSSPASLLVRQLRFVEAGLLTHSQPPSFNLQQQSLSTGYFIVSVALCPIVSTHTLYVRFRCASNPSVYLVWSRISLFKAFTNRVSALPYILN
jgi:hypothetical protein